MNELFDNLKWIAIIVATLAYFILGAIWYSKMLFATKWISYVKINMNDPNAKKGMGMMFVGSFIMMFIQCLAIAILADKLHVIGGWLSGIKIGAFTACCFCSSTVAINYFYEKRPLGLFYINAGYSLVGNIIAGIIICSWKN